jgi:protein-S-isoprenylcysteine O-methyltransferase Ste14
VRTMSLVYGYLFPVIWLGWAAFWWLASRHVSAAARREPRWSRLLHVLPLSLVVVLLAVPAMRIPVLDERFLALAAWPFWTGVTLTAAGLLFAVWARLHIGMNWSGIVTIKQDHELITSGPYALVRHPIYTGILLALAGSALANGQWRGIVALVIAFWALWRKLRLEERWMQEQFGEAYLAYSRRTPALIPFLLSA